MTTPLRIAFAGTPEFALAALDALVASPHRIVGVWTQPDRPAGRGRKLTPSPVKQRALVLGLPVHQPESLKGAEAQQTIRDAAPDVMVVVAYGLLLPPKVLVIPRYGCLNIHASLLPRWRGAAPIQRALLAGDAETGVAIMQMDKGLDTGDVLKEVRTPIAPEDTAETLHDRLAPLGAAALLEVLARLPDAPRRKQPETGITYAHKLSKEEARIDWSKSADELALAVRAYNPWPVAYGFQGEAPLKVWHAVALNGDAAAAPGTVVDAGAAGVDVATGRGLLRILELQPAGGRRLAAADYARGRELKGSRLA
ncbi:MAG TPA: methionyl-tRNA formyltransferase [Gammaproteobacteria bacterium]|nr:methionyl-tRNA formyltransferase [Gammaproteobacteria bacterium]